MSGVEAPHWAAVRAVELSGDTWDASIMLGHPVGRSFAAYIAAHEEPPVDPILIEVRKLAEIYWPLEGALEGDLDECPWFERLHTALKRGIELAKEQSQ